MLKLLSLNWLRQSKLIMVISLLFQYVSCLLVGTIFIKVKSLIGRNKCYVVVRSIHYIVYHLQCLWLLHIYDYLGTMLLLSSNTDLLNYC